MGPNLSVLMLVFGGKNCGFDGKNTVIPAFCECKSAIRTLVMQYAQYYYARLKIEKSGVWGVDLAAKNNGSPHQLR